MKTTPIVTTLALAATLMLGETLPPFGVTAKAPTGVLKTLKVVPTSVDFFGENRSRWETELPVEGDPTPFAFAGEGAGAVMTLKAAGMKPAYTTVRLLLPGNGPANGNVWTKNVCNYVAFECKATKSAKMTFHLLMRGKTAGTYRAAFDAEPGEWQRVVLPVESFGLKNFTNIAGVGFRTREADGGDVAVRNVCIGGTPYTDASMAANSLVIDLKGSWHFRGDSEDRGLALGWNKPGLDDSTWSTLQAGKSWQDQGVDFAGWGWFRQTICIPEGCEGMPLTLRTGSMESDDDVWFNGVRIGGISGAYKYRDRLQRTYAVPAGLAKAGENSIVVRTWGGYLAFQGKTSGLAKGVFSATLDPCAVQFRTPKGKAVDFRLFDVSDAQRGFPFEMLFRFPAGVREGGATRLRYRIADLRGNAIAAGVATLAEDAGTLLAVVPITKEASREVYLRSRLNASLILENEEGAPLYIGAKALDNLCYAKRDGSALPALAERYDETPYGKLRLVDEIDCARPHYEDEHPYLESGVDHDALHHAPGVPGDIHINEYLGRRYRECGLSSWFAYRIGRGGLKPHKTYLLRVEYPEDKSRFACMELQSGQNYTDDGWRNGTTPDGVYDPWPLSKKYEWYDVVFPLDDVSVGAGGTESADAANGFWVYFTNKQNGRYYALWEAGPAVARMRLYEIDPEKNAPVIRYPEGLPKRVFAFDQERQADHDPADFIAYAKLMGYNTICPIILKWSFANYAEPMGGYENIVVDPRNFWASREYDSAKKAVAESGWPKLPSQHRRYLEATKAAGMDYVPRVEWGGSKDLPVSAHSIGEDGVLAKPNRYGTWGANLLDPLTLEDFKTYLDAQIGAFVKDNPQLKGVLWRIRCDRQRISYGEEDFKRFFAETGKKLPGMYAQWRAWAVGAGREEYDAWWHQHRAAYHGAIAEHLRSMRPDLKLFYFNWDGDKCSLILPCTTLWGFNKGLVNTTLEESKAYYLQDEAKRRALSAEDYIDSLRTGNFGDAFYNINRADYGIRPDLYKEIPGVEIFAPINYLCYADKPELLNYFQTHEGMASSNPVAYDEIAARSLNPKYEGNMLTPGGAPYSMAIELLSWFHADARTLSYTVYTYGRGYADAHRRFAQAFLALPAVEGRVVEQAGANADEDVMARLYETEKGTYLGVGYKGLRAKRIPVRLPGLAGKGLVDRVSGKKIAARADGADLVLEINAEPMSLHAFRVE